MNTAMVADAPTVDHEILTIYAEAWDDVNAHCAYCEVTPISAGEEYCSACADVITNYLYANNLD